MKSVHKLKELATILPLLLCLTGCAGASATLQVEKDLPAVPTRSISLSLLFAPDVQLYPEELNALRASLVDSLAWEAGLRVGPKDAVKVIGTVAQYEREPLYEPGTLHRRPSAPVFFDSTWVVLDQDDREIGKARIKGIIYVRKFGSGNDVLEKVGERLGDFLTKQHDAPKPTP